MKDRPPPYDHRAGIAERLVRSGRSEGAVAALLEIDQEIFQWHRAVARGDGAAALLRDLDIGLERAEFGALSAVWRITQGIGRDQAEAATVGLLAQELGIDPSRASRLGGRLIALGLLRREAAQDDARKICLILTEEGEGTLARLRRARWDRTLATFADWDDGDLADFARLMRRFMAATRAQRDGAADPQRRD